MVIAIANDAAQTGRGVFNRAFRFIRVSKRFIVDTGIV
jgi:hypothetical protein